MDKLPQELINIIIDNLYDDHWSLHKCALVCRSLLPAAHRNIFHRVVLWPPNRRYNKRPDDVSYSMRLDRVLLKSPHIADYIRELQVYEGQSLRDQDWITTDQTLSLLLPKLTSLTRIELRRLRWSTVPTDLRQLICGVLELPSLTSVNIEKGTFSNIDDFANLLCYAKGLTSLSLINVSIQHEDQEAEAEEQMLRSYMQRHLICLRLKLNGLPEFVHWLLGSWEVSYIHTLHILDPYGSDTNAINQLLQAIGSSLRHFRLGAPWSLPSTSQISDWEFRFESNSGIKFLHLTSIQIAGYGAAKSLPWLLLFLSNIGKSNQLEEIKLEVYVPEGLVDWSDWEEVDYVLAGPHFKSLRNLGIELLPMGYSTPEWFRETCRNLVCMLPLSGAGTSVNIY